MSTEYTEKETPQSVWTKVSLSKLGAPRFPRSTLQIFLVEVRLWMAGSCSALLISFLHLLSLGQGCQSMLIAPVVLPLCHLIDRTTTYFVA